MRRSPTPPDRLRSLDWQGNPNAFLIRLRPRRKRPPVRLPGVPPEARRRWMGRASPRAAERIAPRGRGTDRNVRFPADPVERQFLFVAGGTGIAPLRSMICHALQAGVSGRLHLLYSARTPADFAYLPEMRRYARDGRLELAVNATREVPERWRGRRGRISRDQLAPLVEDPRRCVSSAAPRRWSTTFRECWWRSGSSRSGSGRKSGEPGLRLDLERRLHVGHPADLARQRHRLGFSSFVLTRPDSVTTPLNVSTSMRNPPTSGSLRSDVFTRVVIVASSIVSSHALPARGEEQRRDQRHHQHEHRQRSAVFIELPPAACALMQGPTSAAVASYMPVA